ALCLALPRPPRVRARFSATARPPTYTLSLHDALPISQPRQHRARPVRPDGGGDRPHSRVDRMGARTCDRRPKSARSSTHSVNTRSEEHTSELQSRENLVCRLLLEKKKREYTDMRASVA